ncbi:hemerythrin domain-containing protein [Planosporangium thailandense]|uniref:Hemerythrin domain-containing protein n=1 Tax=Planosporangium thailandense TaxID=765197 RepID=A0ABX0XYM1_9ACTN|nr:hemerythrin domain-containing protein [Planosporangium thailandense]NJC70325.1 hemerythrin domain-containing protein [Planosporangium thailandense]
MASDAVTLIMNDHRELERLFGEVQSGKGDRRALVEEIAARLTAHSRAEEAKVYPAIKKADPAESGDVDHAYHEHDEAEELLQKVVRNVDSPQFTQMFTEFVQAVKHHVEEEESKVLPALREAVDKDTLDKLGEAFMTARAGELRKAGFDEESEYKAAQDKGRADLADATRDELYEMAREADIPGRSTMNKEELSEAVSRQG